MKTMRRALLAFFGSLPFCKGKGRAPVEIGYHSSLAESPTIRFTTNMDFYVGQIVKMVDLGPGKEYRVIQVETTWKPEWTSLVTLEANHEWLLRNTRKTA